MELAEHLRAIRKYWWMVVLTLVLTVVGAAVITTNTTRLYVTSVTFFVKTPADQLNLAAQGDTFGQKRVNSYVQLAGTDRLLEPVLEATGLDLTTGELGAMITASADTNTVLLQVRVTDSDVDRGLAVADAVAVTFVDVVAELESDNGAETPLVGLELVSGPALNPEPVSPRPALNYGLAVLGGLLAGIVLALVRDFLDTTLRTSSAVEKVTGGAVLGVIPFDATAKKSPLILDSHARSARAEAFRHLRTNLEFVNVDAPIKKVVITSAVPDEGKSSTAANLAVIFAEAGRRVILVEGDLRRPRVADYLGLEGAVGLTNVLAGQADLADVLQPWGRGGLVVLPSGSVPPNPSELLGSKMMGELLDVLSEEFDLVLIDTPPLLPVTDAAVLAARTDGAIVVVRQGSTRRQHVAQAVNSLTQVDARILGSVLTMAPLPRGRGDQYGEGYGYAYGYADNAERPALTDDAVEAVTEALAGEAGESGRRSQLKESSSGVHREQPVPSQS